MKLISKLSSKVGTGIVILSAILAMGSVGKGVYDAFKAKQYTDRTQEFFIDFLEKQNLDVNELVEKYGPDRLEKSVTESFIKSLEESDRNKLVEYESKKEEYQKNYRNDAYFLGGSLFSIIFGIGISEENRKKNIYKIPTK